MNNEHLIYGCIVDTMVEAGDLLQWCVRVRVCVCVDACAMSGLVCVRSPRIMNFVPAKTNLFLLLCTLSR